MYCVNNSALQLTKIIASKDKSYCPAQIWQKDTWLFLCPLIGLVQIGNDMCYPGLVAQLGPD